jgi:hypothetical protein
MSETINKLYQFAVTGGHQPTWIDAKTAFNLPTKLSDDTVIDIKVHEQSERIECIVPFYKLDTLDTDFRNQLFRRLLEANATYNVTMAIFNDTVCLKASYPITYDDKLDKQLFIQNWIDIARFYDEKREVVLLGETQ